MTSAICILQFALCPGTVRADIQAPPKGTTRGERQLQQRTPPPPTPVATKVSMEPGGVVEIVLRADGAQGKTISFLLRTPPAHGEFEGSPRRLSRDAMAVTYAHRAADGPGRDTFSFAAQAPGTAVSSAENVDIEVVDNAPPAAPVPSGAPDLAARPSELDFGAVEEGKITSATLTLENHGSGLANGQLDPPAPWFVDGDAAYSLGTGGRQTFRVVFRPRGQGSFAETLRVDAGTSGCIVRLVGTGLPGVVREPVVTPTPAATPVRVAAVMPGPTVAPSSVANDVSSATSMPGVMDAGPAVTNEAEIKKVKVVAVGASTVELAWDPPVPLPHSYRIEQRSFAYDEREAGKVRIDWLPYERTDFRVRADQVTATLRGLTAGQLVSVRVVSVDAAGRLSKPSPVVNVTTAPGSQWWHLTPLKGLLLLLAACLGLLIRHRLRERRLLRELDAARTAEEAAGNPPRVGISRSFR